MDREEVVDVANPVDHPRYSTRCRLGRRACWLRRPATARSRARFPDRTDSEALAEIERCAGTQFDPRITRLFVEEYRLHGDDIRV